MTTPAPSTDTALMDAVERLLIDGGYAAVTTRRVANEAGQAHGLIRYHFGSLNGLMLATLHRAADRIIERQRSLYAGDGPFLEKWRTAMEYLESDLTDDGFPKLALELISLGWNDDSFRDELARLMERFDEMLTEAVIDGISEYDLELTAGETTALATLIRTFQLGIMVERLADIDVGHVDLLAMIDGKLATLDRSKKGNSHAST